MEGSEETATSRAASTPHSGSALEKLRLRMAMAESMLDEVAALSPTMRSPPGLTAPLRDASMAETMLDEIAALHSPSEWAASPRDAAEAMLDEITALGSTRHSSPELASPLRDAGSSSPAEAPAFEDSPESGSSVWWREEPEPAAALALEPSKDATPPTPGLSPGLETPRLHSPIRDRRDFIRKGTPGGWAEKGLAADTGAVLFNHERVGVHATDRIVLPTGRPKVGSRWKCVSQAGVSARAQFAVAMASGRQLSHLERSCIEESILHIYQPGDCITVKDVLVSDDPVSIAERRARMVTPAAGAVVFANGAERADDRRTSYQVLTDRGWVNLVSRSGKVLFVAEPSDHGNPVADWDVSGTTHAYCAPEEQEGVAEGDRSRNSRRGFLCLSSSRSGPA